MRPSNSDKQRWHRGQTSRAMKNYAKGSQCPKCERKSALKKIQVDPYTIIWVCRWPDCGYERGIDTTTIKKKA